MKFSTSVTVAAIVGLAAAQVPNLPPCALNCLVQGGAAQTACQLTEFKCLCASPDFVKGALACAQKACTSEADQAAGKYCLMKYVSKH